MLWAIVAIVVSIAALGVAAYFYRWVKALPTAGAEIERIGGLIRRGAFTFIKREYRALAIFCAIAGVIIVLFLPHPIWSERAIPKENVGMLLSYLFGSTLSAIAGVAGISIATIANVRAASAARDGISPSYTAGFRGGAVMGMAVVASALAGSAILYLIDASNPEYLVSFSFGASSLALFAKAGGGIFTKTADIAADLTGKVELGIPEDDPRNPAVIADNVGDNVGDVAGMGADLFDSNVAAIAAAIVIAAVTGNVQIVFCFGTLGLLASIIGVFFSKIGPDGDPGRALNRGTYLTCALFAVFTFVVTLIDKFGMPDVGSALRLWGASALGMIVGVIIGVTSDFFTGDDRKPVLRVAAACKNGPAFTILSGFSYGLLSTLPSMAGIGVAALLSYKLLEPMGGAYPMLGIAMSAIGMLSVVGMIIANDAFGPIVDNARGLAEMCSLGDEVLETTDKLDAAGNTAKAITKGFAIGAAGLTVIALLGAFQETAQQAIDAVGSSLVISFDIMDPLVFFGAIIGSAIPAVFSAMLIMGVDRNSEKMVVEIHRQFDTIPGLKEGKKGVSPEYDKCIDIATVGAIRELIPAGLMAIASTLAVGFIGGVNAVGGFLIGNILTGLLLALLMSNAGGLWDNAKKYIESGNFGGKGSDAHRAAVIGDTVGDPFKDTAGPSINTQITVVSLVSSLAAGLFVLYSLIG
ncbi:MAG: sodium-translocating pyrophosphatase [Christensenellales bacterium]|jgi:K(+)-stimulated pyrophosphate-energized sodium pump